MRIKNALAQPRSKVTVTAALTAAAVAIAAVGVSALDVQTSAFWERPHAQMIPAVPAVAWAPGNGTSMLPFLAGAQNAGTGAKVDGTRSTTPSHPTSLPGAAGQVRVTTAALLSQVSPKLAVPPANPAGAGDFTALPGTGAGQWGVAGQTGSFTWSYPLTGRAAPAGPSPSLAFAYDSSSVDGLTSSTNNQATPVGDGWTLAGLGTIRQRFAPCMDQGVASSYDLCGNPGGQSLSISFGGRSGTIVKDATTGAYHLGADDGTKVEYLTAAGQNGTFDGGYWKLTDTSGTQYFFGRNKLPGWAAGSATTNSADTVPVGAANSSQPCTAGSFGASLCQQAYAWNLDYVVDTHGNSEAVYYAQDTNWYASQAGAGANLQYVRTSRPTRVDYGMRSGSELTASAPLQYTFAYTGRCTGVDCTKGTDVPTGLSCASTGTCATQSPTFYTDQRLQTVTAQTLVGTAYQAADSWALAHAMPDPGDGTKPALWLGSVAHTGANTAAGTAVTDPATTFAGQTLQNRVMVADGLAPLDRYRLSSITTPTGSVVSVSYMGQECSSTNLPASPQANTKRCFPQWWAPSTPIAQPARMDYFHIYPVAAIGVSAGPGGNGSVDTLTSYQYLGTPAYKYAAPKYVAGSGGSQLTWSVLAGWGQVKTITGNDSGGANPTTTTTYLRGLDGTPSDTSGGTVSATVTTTDGTAIKDSPWFAGATVETQTFLGTAGARLTDTVTVPWASAPTATGAAGLGSPTARHTGPAQVTTSEASSQSGGTRSRTVKTTYDAQGRPTSVSTGAETGTTGTASCVLTAYADNTGANLLALPATVTTRAGECAADGTSTGDILAATATLYDSSTSAVPGSSGYTQPTKGEAARTDTATANTGGTVTAWLQGPSRTFDALGRVLTSTDSTTGTARTTTTAYSPATGVPTTVTATNPLGWQTSQTLDAVRGQVLTDTDANGYATTNVYDASGRLTKTWDPLRPQATYPSTPSKAITYSVSQTAPSWVKTDTVVASGSTMPNYTVYDGAGRVRQTQRNAPGGGAIATNTFYNSAGQVSRTDNDFVMTSSPTGTLMIPTLAVPSSTTYAYDGAGRGTVVTAVANDNQTLWATTTSYTGADTTTVTGPGNAAATQTVTSLSGDTVC
ncbi:hypothetical protein [Sinomonas atrocyanea]|uniref:hypothetical protein n=1 Tax=Sinomonas atrocyanea TaxID=37927 RepID=UPI0028668CA5|nr:hypothetical protein [Sinomonas atrocyanea]MDR6623481.1 YD repeat-containing protein [Sinomonas atrocyanea]